MEGVKDDRADIIIVSKTRSWTARSARGGARGRRRGCVRLCYARQQRSTILIGQGVSVPVRRLAASSPTSRSPTAGTRSRSRPSTTPTTSSARSRPSRRTWSSTPSALAVVSVQFQPGRGDVVVAHTATTGGVDDAGTGVVFTSLIYPQTYGILATDEPRPGLPSPAQWAVWRGRPGSPAFRSSQRITVKINRGHAIRGGTYLFAVRRTAKCTTAPATRFKAIPPSASRPSAAGSGRPSRQRRDNRSASTAARPGIAEQGATAAVGLASGRSRSSISRRIASNSRPSP